MQDKKHEVHGLPEFGFMRLPDVLRVFPVSKSTWYAGVAKGIFPAPAPLGPRTSGWRVEDIKDLCRRAAEGELYGGGEAA